MSVSAGRDLRAYDAPYYVERYRSTRQTPEELFPSERHFLSRCVRPGLTVLDVGCACGGFYRILTTLEPAIRYCGVDISPTLVAQARETYPAGKFDVCDGISLPYGPSSFDLVQTWGVLLHEPEYWRLLAESWRVTRATLLFDVRLQIGQPEVVDRDRAFVLNPGGVKNFYIVPEAVAFVRRLLEVCSPVGEIEIFGYRGSPNRFVTLPSEVQSIFMAGVRVVKDEARPQPVVTLHVPGELGDVLEAALADSVSVQRKSDDVHEAR